mmetsp:Transcript_6214/g.13521  ORF Transcript_6214/g.13521 Transcript_6214/m.13521 type:complete len:466 (+) Transcript_6214:123-1520(+)
MAPSPDSTTRRYDLAIIGRGMIGSAAARHAAKLSRGKDLRIVLIGPSEQSCTDRAVVAARDMDGDDASSLIFGAHYDEGRITRRTDPDPIWAELASRSISRYNEILHESGLDKNFYSECGHLAVGQNEGDVIKKRRQAADSMGVEIECLDADVLSRKFPQLDFSRDCVGLHEKKHAGYISARGLVEAQTNAAQNLGVHIIDDVVNSVERCICENSDNGYYFSIEVGSRHERIESTKLLVAAGAFCNSRPLLPKKLKVTPIKTQTVHFVLNEDDAIRLKDMPSVIIKNDKLWAYILPPIQYPDGTVRLKLGGSYLEPNGKEYGLGDREIHSHNELANWYRSGGSNNARRDMEHMLHSFVPNISPVSIISNSCATLNTPTGQVYIDENEDGWAMATGGNGLAAKSSDELGRLAATCILDREAFRLESICGKSVAEVFCPICDENVGEVMTTTTKTQSIVLAEEAEAK